MTITYTPDGVEPTSRRPQRRVEARCAQCQAKHDGARETQDANGEWQGNTSGALVACGWVESAGMTFCGKHCQQRYEYATRSDARKPAVPVLALNDASWKPPVKATDPKFAPRR